MVQVRWISRKQLDKIEKELDYLKKHTVWVGFVGSEAFILVRLFEIDIIFLIFLCFYLSQKYNFHLV